MEEVCRFCPKFGPRRGTGGGGLLRSGAQGFRGARCERGCPISQRSPDGAMGGGRKIRPGSTKVRPQGGVLRLRLRPARPGGSPVAVTSEKRWGTMGGGREGLVSRMPQGTMDIGSCLGIGWPPRWVKGQENRASLVGGELQSTHRSSRTSGE